MYRNRKWIVLALLLALLAGMYSPAIGEKNSEAKAKQIKLSKTKLTINGDSKKKVTLKIKNLPKKAKTTWVVKGQGKKLVSLSAKKRASVKIKGRPNGRNELKHVAKVVAKVKVPKKKVKKLTCTVKVVYEDEPFEKPTPEPTIPPRIEPQQKAELKITADGVVTGTKLDNVYEIEIPDGVKEIGTAAFEGCNTLEKITIPEGVEKIDERAFNECTRLKEVVFPSTVREVGKEAFFECISLENVSLNDGLLSLGAGSFFQCSHLKSVTIPSSLTSLGDYAFAWCRGLETVQIDAALTEIPQECFDSCGALKTVNIPSTVKKIGQRAFYGNAVLFMLTLPGEMDEIGDNAFYGAGIPEQTINARVIGKNAFEGTRWQSIALGDAVEEIGEEAFSGDGDYEKGSVMTIPASVKSIAGGKSFSSMALRAIKVAAGNPNYKAVGGVLFSADGKRLIAYPRLKTGKDYTVPDGVEEIAPYAFSSTALSGTITLPASLRKIGENAFQNGMISKLVIPEGLESVGAYAFSTSAVKSLTLPDTVKEIGESAMSQMSSLKNLKLSASLTAIPKKMLENNGDLTAVTIPDSVTTIDPTAFQGCEKLKDYSGLTFGAGTVFSVKDGMLFDKSGTKLLSCPVMDEEPLWEDPSFTVPDGVKVIGTNSVNPNYSTVIVPNSVETIEPYALGYGYVENGGAWAKPQDVTEDFYILSSSKVALDYAKKYGVNIISEEDPDYIYGRKMKVESGNTDDPDKNVKHISLKAGETATMKVKGVVTEAYYSSSDKKIATVDDKGVITAVANGTTTIIEASGTMFFCLEVTVTGGTDPVYDDGLLKFADDDEAAVAAWEQTYFKFNPTLWFTRTDYPAIDVYSGNDYNAVTAPYYGRTSSNWKVFITDAFGPGCGEYFVTLSNNLDRELREPKLNQDLLLFSGKNAIYGVDYVTVDGGFTVKSLIDSIGTTPTYTSVISTSLYRSVADNFSGGIKGTVFEIEGRKDKVNGMMIRHFAEYETETEFLLNHGMKFRIADAGVRRFTVGKPDDDGIYAYSVKTYLRMEIIG